MLSRIVGALVVMGIFGGCAYLGVQEMVTEQRVGGWPALALILLAGPLLVVGWIATRVGRLFIGRWQHDYFNRTLRERRLAGLGVAVLSGGLLYAAVGSLVPSQHPGHELTAALKLTCTDGAVVAAGGAHRAGMATAHLVVLGSDGYEQRWTGHAPMEWKPANLADTELVACVSAQDAHALIQTCHYTIGPALKRYNATRHVKLIEPGSGRAVAEYDVTDVPPTCPQTKKVEATTLMGRVEWPMVQARLATYAGCCAPTPTASPGRPGERPQVTPRFSAPPMPTPVMPLEPTAPPMPVETPVPVRPETPVP